MIYKSINIIHGFIFDVLGKKSTLNLGLGTHLHLPQAGCDRAFHYHSRLEISKRWLGTKKRVKTPILVNTEANFSHEKYSNYQKHIVFG